MKEVERMENVAFTKAYNALNAAQKRAVDAIEGPVMVIAGPGTGKTQILALRIANILQKTDIPPSAILALTFTEAGVASMRNRLVSLIGARGYHVRIHTFHGFCNTIIKKFPERFPRIIGNEQILEIDALKIIESIIDSGSFASLRPVNFPYYYVREIKSALSETKRENVSPSLLRERVEREEAAVLSSDDLYHAKGAHAGKMKGKYTDELARLAKARVFAEVYALYEAELEKQHLYDFEDTILEVVHMLEKDEDLKLMLQEEHQYVLADEHQDANGAQNRLLELVSDFHESPNLFIVGDEKQAIYRFQGASLANFLFFKERYPTAALIELESNYRSTQVVLDAAHDVIMPSSGHEDIPRPRLVAKADHAPHPVSLSIAHTEDAELADMVRDIEVQSSESPYHEMVVLARRNVDVARVSYMLRKRGILVSSANDEQVLGVPLVRSFLDLLRAVAHFGDDASLYPLLYAPFFKLDNLDIYRLTEKRETKKTLFETLGDSELLKASGVADGDRCHTVFKVIDAIATYAKDAPLVSSIDYALEQSGLLAYLMEKPDRYVVLEAIRALVRYMNTVALQHPAYGFRELLASLATAEDYGLSLLAAKEESGSAVRVMTVHKAKGLEFDHVYIPFMHDARWGSSRSRAKITLPLYVVKPSEEEVSDDERRLLYVAMTRARKTLHLSYSTMGDDGREQVPSRFIADISPEHVKMSTIEKETFLEKMTEPVRRNEDFLVRERAHIRTRLEMQGMSVSALNNYLESPWRYFFQNLLRMPSAKEPHQHFGTAMDSALKLITQMEREGVRDVERVYGEFERILFGAPMREVDRGAYLERGREALGGYLKEYGNGEGSREVDAGIRFSVPFETGMADLATITLHGEYDRVEFLGDGVVRVVDFKTGSPKTRNYIEGNTKDSNGNYKRQLVFYALLASLDPVRAWNVREGVIDFVEADDKGKYHREVFPITSEDVEELKGVLTNALREIGDFAFFESVCDPETWTKEGCDLVTAFKKRFEV